MKRLLILGSLGEFTRLVQKARARGIYTIVCDGYPHGPARQYADASYTLPVTDILAIADLSRREKADAIITSFSDLLFECMVKIASLAGLPCYLKPEQLPFYRDKSRMKELLQKLGIPTPAFRKITKDFSSEDLQGLGFPLVTKPLDRYGSRGLCVVHSPGELKERFSLAAQYSDSGEILVEEYNDGLEFNLMTWVLDGQVRCISLADREKTPVGPEKIPISSRNVYPSRLLSSVMEPALSILQRFADATGQTDGPLSMQFFWSPDKGVQVGEIAGRFFGYEHDLTDIALGLNMEDLLLDSLYDRESLKDTLLHHDPVHPRRFGAVLYFQGRELPVADLSTARRLAGHPAVLLPWIFYQEGERVEEHGPNPYVALYYVAADSRDRLDQITEEFFREMSVKDPQGREVLYRNRIPGVLR